MKTLIIRVIGIASIILFVQDIYGQINFRNTTIQVPNITSTLEAVEIGDVNNDGLNDVVVASQQDDITKEYNIYIYKQNLDGMLSAPEKLAYPGGYPYISDLEIADLNNDKLNDIAILYDGKVGIFYQLSNGGFSSIQNFTGPVHSNGFRCGDLNNDGLNDIVGYSTTASYKILYQKPEGGFSLTKIPTTMTNANAGFCNQIEIGDLNGDNLNDMVKIYYYRIEILFQKVGAGMTTENAIILTLPDQLLFQKVTIGDVNNDGKNDIIATYGGNYGRVVIYYQTGNGLFSTANSKTIITYDCPTPVFAVDFNCDGNKELVVGHSGWSGITTFEKSSTQDYNSYNKYPSLYYSTPFSMAVGDINNDKRPDVVAVGQGGKMNILYNSSKPLTFDKIGLSVENLSVKTDTTSIRNTVYTPIIDTALICKKNKTYKLIINKTFENKHFTGDSIKVRSAYLCSPYIDTLNIPFNYTNSRLLKCDTIASMINLDKLEALVYKPNLSATDTMNYIYVKTNICWNLSSDQNWIRPDTTSGNLNTYVMLTISPNTLSESRTATIIVTGDSISPVYINITQSGNNQSNGILNLESSKFSLYPNPTTDNLVISNDYLTEVAEVKIYDLTGKIVLIDKMKTSKTEINLSKLTQGIYTAQINIQGRTVRKKIVKI